MEYVRYSGTDTMKSETGVIHLKDGLYTACGVKIDNTTDWQRTSHGATCMRSGCKQKILSAKTSQKIK